MKLFGKMALFCTLLLSIFASPVEAGPVTGATVTGMVWGAAAVWAYFKGTGTPRSTPIEPSTSLPNSAKVIVNALKTVEFTEYVTTLAATVGFIGTILPTP